MAAPKLKVFSLEGKGLKLDTAEDLEPHIEALRTMDDVEEVRLLGNTLGVEACRVLGEVLETKKSLQVCHFGFQWKLFMAVLISYLGSQPGGYLHWTSTQ
jgi:Ran GTPase-activating protein (RanGAP) involved in mRNA processing and transport